MKFICVFGSVSNKLDNAYIKMGFDLGKMIAERNYGLIFSGMKDGISGAVAKGVAANGNSPIIGVMPEFFKEQRRELIFSKCTEEVFTKSVAERKEYMKYNSDIIIVTPGGLGTFDEMFDSICSRRMDQINKPIIILNYNGYYNKLIEMLDYTIESNFGNKYYRDAYKIFENLEEIFEYIDNYTSKV